MYTKTVEKPKIKYVTHEWVFQLMQKPLVVDIYPDLGDTSKDLKDRWVFTIPRLGITNYEVFRTYCLAHEVTEGERDYVDPGEAVKDFVKKRQEMAVERQRREAERQVARSREDN